MNLRWLSFVFFYCYQVTACASLTILTFKSKDDVSVRAVDWSDLNGAGQDLGHTPVDVELENVKGKVLVLTAPERQTQYWVVPHTTGERLEANVQLEEKKFSSEGKSAAKEFPVREYSRLLMKSYQALYKKDYKVATELASKLTQLAPQDPAPSIISGLSLLQSGNRDDARAQFEKAQALDPDNQDIRDLVKLAK